PGCWASCASFCGFDGGSIQTHQPGFHLFTNPHKTTQEKAPQSPSPSSLQKKPRRQPTRPRHHSAVPAAQQHFTTGFEKRPGITLPPIPPRKKTVNNVREHPATCSGQALGLLVPVSSTPYKASTPGLSTPSSTGSLNP